MIVRNLKEGENVLTKEERETVIVINEAENEVIIDTSIATHIRKFDKLGYKCISEQKYPDGTTESKQYKVPKFAISFRKPVKREISEEQRQRLSERAKEMWGKK